MVCGDSAKSVAKVAVTGHNGSRAAAFADVLSEDAFAAWRRALARPDRVEPAEKAEMEKQSEQDCGCGDLFCELGDRIFPIRRWSSLCFRAKTGIRFGETNHGIRFPRRDSRWRQQTDGLAGGNLQQ